MNILSLAQMETLTGGEMVDAVGCAFGVASMMLGFVSLGALTGGLSIAAVSAVVGYTGGLYSVVKGCQSA